MQTQRGIQYDGNDMPKCGKLPLDSKGKGLLGPNGGSGGGFEGGFEENVGSCGGNVERGGSIVGSGGGSFAKRSMVSKDGLGDEGGVENKSLIGSIFKDNGEECLDGWVRADGGEVKGGGDDFGVSRILLGDIPRVIIGESGGETFGVDNRWVVKEHDKEGTMVAGWRSNKDGH
ncbi:hypothetical protein Tco_0863216 [Tanacetum coccineum]